MAGRLPDVTGVPLAELRGLDLSAVPAPRELEETSAGWQSFTADGLPDVSGVPIGELMSRGAPEVPLGQLASSQTVDSAGWSSIIGDGPS